MQSEAISGPTDFGTTDGTPTQDEKNLAALGHGLTFFEGGLFGPLILYFVKREESAFVAFHALQSLLFGLVFFGLTIVSCGLLGVLLVIPYMVFEGIATIKAYEGEWYELPIVGRYAREKHPG